MRQIRLTLLLLLMMLFTTQAYADAAFADRPDVKAFMQQMVTKYHFDKQALITIFSSVKIRPQVIQHVNRPLEQKASWHTYQMLFVDEWRIERGAEFWDKYADALQRAENTYGVPAGVIVATIGVETRYGQKTGNYRVIDSLSNIAFSNSSRAKFFKSELEQFLLLARDEQLDPLKIMGSYAGAMGQPQFMPSSYRYYAVNFSKSGKIDLMHNEVDVIGSIANYYHQYGWHMGQPVAVPAIMIGDRYHYLMRQDNPKRWFTLAELARYGVIPKEKIPGDKSMKVRVIELQNQYSKEYWIGFHNFYVIKRYNSSDLYAMAIFQLSTYITDLRKQLNHG